MTSRLLRARLGSPGYEDMRATLRAAGTATVAERDGVTVTAAALPLFRNQSDGGLRQAVRVTVHGGSGGTATLADGDQVIDTGAVEGGRIDLWLPEVTAPREVTVEAAGLSGRFTVEPQRKFTVHVMHHSHLDIGYTDRQGVVLRHHLDYLDSAVELSTTTDEWPDDAKFRWTVESALPVKRWLESRDDAAVARFIELVKQGRIEVTAMPFQLHTEACSVEELHRMLRFTDELRDRHGIPVTSAMHTDVPGAVVGFVDALAASGVHYLSAAHNWAGRSVPFLTGGQDLGRPFWWRSPAGNRVLVWFTDSSHGMAYMEGNVVGLAESFAASVDLLPGYLHQVANKPVPYGSEAFGWSVLDVEGLTKKPYPHDLLHLRVQGGNADNAGPSILPPSIVRAWNEAYAYPKLRMATNTEFFEEAQQRFGDKIEEHEGDWTDWWADGLGSGARPLGYARRAQHAVRHAETLHQLAGAAGEAAPAVEAIYDKLGLFDEHTWGAANPWHDHEDGFDSGGMQWARKCEMAYSAADDAEDLRRAGAHRLGARFTSPDGALAAYLVTNLGQADRTDLATVFVPASTVPFETRLSIVDSRGGAVVPHHEEEQHPKDWPTRPGGRWVSFVAADVPATGHVRFDVVETADKAAQAIDLGQTWQVQNEFYRVDVDPKDGSIVSVFDKRAGRELVNRDAYAGLNQYVYDKYSTAPHINHLTGHIEATDEHLTLLGGRSIGRRPSIVRAQRTAVGETLEIELDAEGTGWLRSTISVTYGVPRVDITNRMEKSGTPAKESVFFAFPFALPAPVAWELTGGVGGPDVPTVPGAAQHMTPIRHWVAFDDGELTAAWATLQAPLAMIGDLFLPYAPFPPTVKPEPAEPGTVYSWALNNIWDTNFPAQQQGETTFQYAIASRSGADPRELGAAAAAGMADPFVAAPVTGGAEAPLAPSVHRWATIDHPLIRVAGFGPSRRGHDLVVYLASTAADEVTVELGIENLAAAAVGTSLERDQVALDVSDSKTRVPVPPGGFVAVSVDRSEA
ncbi:MAG TPA: hypothetical protein VGP16_08545, partial [Asanoa sp.]|nr:hypothetical protein [Asanoa sp.]